MAYAIIKPKRGTASEWMAANPILATGELGFEMPNGGVGTGVCKVKIGDGKTVWSNLPYAIAPEIYMGGVDTSDFVTTEQLATNNEGINENINAVSISAATALSNAANAQSVANTARTAADTAQQTANTAISAADTAQGTAESAMTYAQTVNSKLGSYMPMAGGTFTGNAIAHNANRNSKCLRNILVQDSAGTAVATDAIYLRRKT